MQAVAQSPNEDNVVVQAEVGRNAQTDEGRVSEPYRNPRLLNWYKAPEGSYGIDKTVAVNHWIWSCHKIVYDHTCNRGIRRNMVCWGIRSTRNKTNNFHIQRILKSNRFHTKIFVCHRFCAPAQISKHISKKNIFTWF